MPRAPTIYGERAKTAPTEIAMVVWSETAFRHRVRFNPSLVLTSGNGQAIRQLDEHEARRQKPRR